MKKLSVSKFPWLTFSTLLLFIIGYVITINEFPFHRFFYTILLIIAVISVNILERKLTNSLSFDIPLWISFSVIVSTCYVKFFLIALNPASPYLLGLLPFPPNEQSNLGYLLNWESIQLYSLTLCTVGLLSLSLSVYFIDKNKVSSQTFFKLYKDYDFWMVFLTACFLTLILAFISFQYGVGVMGKQIENILPFHLRGVIYYLNNYFLLSLILLTIHFSLRLKSKLYLVLSVSLLITHGLINFLITSSKASFLGSFLLLMFFFIASELKISKKYMIACVFILIMLFLCVPYMHAVRDARIHNNGLVESVLMSGASINFNFFKLISDGFIWIIYRLPGIEIVSGILSHKGTPLYLGLGDVLMTKNGVSGYLTNSVFDIPVDQPHMNAPGYWGWWYLAFGIPGVFIGGLMMGAFVRFIWPMVFNLKIQSGPILRAFVLMTFFTLITEGTIDSMLRPISAILLSILTIEIYLYVRFR